MVYGAVEWKRSRHGWAQQPPSAGPWGYTVGHGVPAFWGGPPALSIMPAAPAREQRPNIKLSIWTERAVVCFHTVHFGKES